MATRLVRLDCEPAVRYMPIAMYSIPRWLVFLVAFWVIAFGLFRIYIAKQKLREPKPGQPNLRKGGLYAQSRRRHIVFGFAYVVLGAVLIAMGFGVRLPMVGGCQGGAASETPSATSGDRHDESAGSIEATPVVDPH